MEMEDNAIPEEYFTCHGDKLFDLLASALVDFAKRHGRFAVACLWLPDAFHISLKNSDGVSRFKLPPGESTRRCKASCKAACKAASGATNIPYSQQYSVCQPE